MRAKDPLLAVSPPFQLPFSVFPFHCEANCAQLSATIIGHTAPYRLRPQRPADQTHIPTRVRAHVRRGGPHVRRAHTVCMRSVSPPTHSRLCSSGSGLSAFTSVFIVSLYWSSTWHGKVERPTILWIYLKHPSNQRAPYTEFAGGGGENSKWIG